MFKLCINTSLSETHLFTLEAICDYILINKKSPTVREIAALTGRSLQPTQLSLDILRQKGYLNWSEGQARTMFVTLDKI